MTRAVINRGAVAMVTAALSLGATGPAFARPNDLFVDGGPAPVAAPVTNTARQPQAPQAVATPALSTRDTGISPAVYVLIGAGGASVTLVGLGAIGLARQRRFA